MRYLYFLIIFMVSTPMLAAQDTSFLRLYAGTQGFLRGRPSKFQFTDDNKFVLFLRSSATDSKLILHSLDLATGKIEELLTGAQLSSAQEENLTIEEKARRERMRLTAKGIADFWQIPHSTKLLVPLSGKLYTFDRSNKQIKELKTGPSPIDPVLSPDGSKLAYVLKQDVFVYDLKTDKEAAVTHGGTPVKTHGLAEFVAQEEMGRMHGFWWSPDSSMMLIEEADHAGVEQWTVSDPSKPESRGLPQYYPRPGKKNVSVRLGLIAIADGMAGKDPRWIKFEALEKYLLMDGRDKAATKDIAWEYLANVVWTKESNPIVLWQDRKQQVGAYFKLDPTEATSEIIDCEYERAFLNIDSDLPKLIPSSKFYIYLQQKFRQQMMSIIEGDSGKLSGLFEYTPFPEEKIAGTKTVTLSKLVSISSDGKEAIFTGFPHSKGIDTNVSQLHLYRAEVAYTNKPKEPERISNEPGQHSAVYAKDHSWSIRTHTSIKNMPQTKVWKGEEKSYDIPCVGPEPELTLNWEWTRCNCSGIKRTERLDFAPEDPNSINDEQLSCCIVRPHNFDPKKKYPVIVNVYGGPRHLTVVNSMRPWLIMQWLADQGFIVAGIDNRGTPGRSRFWERCIYEKFGTLPLFDQMDGVRELSNKYPQIDFDRAGIVGWSFGGYMSALAMMKPSIFKAGVAGAPVTDWEDYDTHYTERYMGLLPENQKVYDEANLVKQAKNLHGPLMIVHGTADDNVYFRHSLRLADALFRAGKEFEFVPLAAVTHMYIADPTATEELWARSARFFKKHLGEPK